MSTKALIVSGYLGAGKTTLINQYLQSKHSSETAVLVNDFGQINLDALQIKRQHGNVIELSNGCACCSIGDSLLQSANQVMAMSPKRLVIEASGVADPGRLRMLLKGVKGLEISKIATVINQKKFQRNLNDKYITALYRRQIELADIISNNRQANGVDKAIKQLNADALQIETLNSVFEIDSTATTQGSEYSAPHFHSVHLIQHMPCSPEVMKESLLGQSGTIERAKGALSDGQRCCWVDFVQGEWQTRTALPDEQFKGIVIIAKQRETIEALCRQLAPMWKRST